MGAFRTPVRKLYYNLTIIGISVLVAVAVGAIEALGLLAETLGLEGGIWRTTVVVSGHFDVLGYLIVGVFAASWLVSFAIYRTLGYHKIGSA